MSSHVPAELRRAVLARAGGRCEYCRLPVEHAELGVEVDHVLSEQHGGATDEGNLAAACFRCNRAKGPNVAAIDDVTGEAVILFNPRLLNWGDHFTTEGVHIVGLTAVGRVTVRVLAMNGRRRLDERVAASRLHA